MLQGDLPEVMAIEQASHSHPWSESNFTSSIKSAHHAVCVRHQNQIIAYAVFSKVLNEAELLNITVSSDFRQQGVAQSLLQAIVNRLESQHTVSMFFRSEGVE